MRRRPSPEIEEDDPSDDNLPSSVTLSLPQSPVVESDSSAKRRSFTSSKFDVARLSDSLDRRKVEKSLVSATSSPQHDWEPGQGASQRNSIEKETQVQHDQPLEHSQPSVAGAVDGMDSKEWRRSRPSSPWRCSLLTLITTLSSILVLAVIVNSFFKRQLDPKGCKMCYMSPGFAKLHGFDTEHTRFASKYSVYLYREVGLDEDTMVKGVPVLFITGNAGSYKQVRPLGSEAANYYAQYLSENAEATKLGTRNLDFFSADFNEDITAFHGQTLLDQAEYLNEAIAYILSLYHDPKRSRRDPGLPDPTSVVILAHSMGGIVARTMLVMPNYQANSINTIITMSTPHARAPVSFDSDIVSTYQKTNDYWRQAYSQKWANNNPLWHVTLISIAGGGLDTTVPSDYTSLSSLVPDTHGFNVFTSSIPNVWTGSDHLSILWCNQLRQVIVRSIFEVVDARRPSQTKPRAERMRIFKKWYLTGMERVAEKTLPQKEPTTLLTLEDNFNSILSAGERLNIPRLGGTGKPKPYLIPVPPPTVPGEKRFTLLTDQSIDSTDGGKLEVLFCSVFPLHSGQSATLFSMDMDLSGASSGSTRLACKNAASDVIKLPASRRTSQYPFDDGAPFSYLQYNLEDISEHQFIAVVDKSSSLNNGWVVAEFSENLDSHINADIGLARLLMGGLRVTLPAGRPLVTEVKVPAVHSSLLAYKLAVSPQSCGDNTELFSPLLRQYITEPFESKFFVNVKETDINLHGIAPFMPPALRAHSMIDGILMQFWSDPTCNSSIDISLKVDFIGSLGKLVMRYRTVFPAIPLVIIALVLRKQFMVHDHTGVFMSFSEALDLCLRSSLPILLLAMTFFSISLSNSSSQAAKARSAGLLHWRSNATEPAIDYSKNDLLLGSQDPFFWFLIPLFGFIGVGACVILNYAALMLVSFFSLAYSLVRSTPGWLGNNDRRRPGSSPTFATASPKRRIMITFILLFMVSTFIPYQFAYIVACIVQIATCTRAMRVARETRSSPHYNFYNYAHSILVLMLWVLPINLPVLVVWVHNLAVHWLTPFSSHHNVLSIMPFILLVESLTGGTMIPRIVNRFRHITNLLFFLLAVYAAIYGVTYAYQLHYLANLICAWLVTLHFSASNLSIASFSKMLEGGDDGFNGNSGRVGTFGGAREGRDGKDGRGSGSFPTRTFEDGNVKKIP